MTTWSCNFAPSSALRMRFDFGFGGQSGSAAVEEDRFEYSCEETSRRSENLVVVVVVDDCWPSRVFWMKCREFIWYRRQIKKSSGAPTAMRRWAVEWPIVMAVSSLPVPEGRGGNPEGKKMTYPELSRLPLCRSIGERFYHIGRWLGRQTHVISTAPLSLPYVVSVVCWLAQGLQVVVGSACCQTLKSTNRTGPFP